MSISVKDVEYLAHLARIQLSPEEIQRFAGQLDEILGYVEKLKSVSTEGVPPTSHVLSLSNVFREDRTRPSLSPEEALANAPDKEGPFFRVPKIIEAT
jgi:aspartyl-tRNA(Asn)/glutamyl-tRNA(Gln) amidotransferase subunit C